MPLNQRSVDRLDGVHADLVAIVARASQLCDFIVTEGLRTHARQKELYAQGRTRPGKVVTWSMQSRHLTGHAVDLCPPAVDGVIPWGDKAAFDAIYAAMMQAADEYGFALRSGMDWDRDGNKRERGESDSPHYELPSADYP